MGCFGNCALAHNGAIFLNAMALGARFMTAIVAGARTADLPVCWSPYAMGSMRRVCSIGTNGGSIAPLSGPAALLLSRGKRGPKNEPADHALGRSRGGYGTKLHLLCDGNGLPLGALLLPGQAHESPQFEQLVETVQVQRASGRLRRRPRRIGADRAYDAQRDHFKPGANSTTRPARFFFARTRQNAVSCCYPDRARKR
jgi:hypothetical protein